MSRLCYYPHDHATILVGHSLFFQRFCTKFMSPEFQANNPDRAKQIQNKIMANASCLAIEIDFSGSIPVITNYEDLFGEEKNVYSNNTQND